MPHCGAFNAKDAASPEFVEDDWEAAFAEIGKRLRPILEKYGPDAIGIFFGNPIGYSSKAEGPAYGLASKLGTTRAFNVLTQDLSNKPAAAEAIFGTLNMFPVPDYYSTDYLICFGNNPKVSHWTQTSTSRPLHLLQDIIGRGGQVRFVNPRRVESVGPTTGELVQIKPDTDVYLMAAMLYHIDRHHGFREDVIARYGKHVEELRAFIAKYPPDRVARIVGITADEIECMASEFAQAKSAAVYMATGVNQSRQGTLGYWLLNMLSFVTANLGVPGGNYYAQGLSYGVRSASKSQTRKIDTPLGEMRMVAGALPGYALADFIELEEADNPIRALIVLAGNPLISLPGEMRLRSAFTKLEFMVSVDLYRNATGEYADYILPSSDWLEREDINHVPNGYQPRPYVQYTDAVVPPRAQRKDDWWIVVAAGTGAWPAKRPDRGTARSAGPHPAQAQAGRDIDRRSEGSAAWHDRATAAGTRQFL